MKAPRKLNLCIFILGCIKKGSGREIQVKEYEVIVGNWGNSKGC